MNFQVTTDFLEDEYADDYEKANMASEHFGVPKEVILQIEIIKQLKELNRLIYNKWEARQ